MNMGGFSWKRLCLIFIALAVSSGLYLAWRHQNQVAWFFGRLRGGYTAQQRVAQYGKGARARIVPAFRAAGVPYPPKRIVFVALKRERTLTVYGEAGDGRMRRVRSYTIVAASGKLGPKLREGDGQVPEGIYGITFLNPNSKFHLSMQIGYPNAFDRAMARKEGRGHLGGEIMIHGDTASVGCLAMGDQASEDLFVLAADTGMENTKVVICPLDFRRTDLDLSTLGVPPWTRVLYSNLRQELSRLP